MSNSSLVTYTKLSSHNSGQRTHSVDRFTPHCIVGQWTAKQGCDYFASTTREASCNYVVGKDGSVGLCVEENKRSWCSSSAANDQRAITVECASDANSPYAFTDACYNKLIDLCVDVCKRYNKTKLVYIANKTQAINYEPKSGEMQLTFHRFFANKACPGDWFVNKANDFVNSVNARLGSTTTQQTSNSTSTTTTLYRVRTSWDNAKSQIGAYKSLDNAKKACKSGYNVYDSNGNVVYSNGGATTTTQATTTTTQSTTTSGVATQSTTTTTSTKKSNEEIANEVINGNWGSGEDRKKRLAAAGYDYSTIQSIVNAKLSGKSTTTTSTKKSNETIAKEVIAGKWGTGATRKQKLEAAGYNYSTIQSIVNKMLK